MTGRDILNELLAELPPKPSNLRVDAYLNDTSFNVCTYIGPMERERRSEITVDLREPDSLKKVREWLDDIIAELIY